MTILIAALGVLAAIGLSVIAIAICFRIVVSTNETHIVQSAKRTVSYGKDQQAGNTYYAWPAWIPVIGIRVIKLPVSVFDLRLDGYAAYDKGRVPFVVDIMAFFRIDDANTAAQRVHTIDELRDQLEGILQGASRSILAQSDLHDILEKRSEFGQMFTAATADQLKAWGVTNVKNIELMDIRDGDGSHVVGNIMAMKKSQIERESRVTVAENMRTAKEAEIAADQAVATRKVEAEQLVEMRGVEKQRTVQISTQEATQAIREQEALTATKTMAVKQVEIVRAAEIDRDKKVVEAEQVKRTTVINAEGVAAAAIASAEGQKRQTELVAEGNLAQALRSAEGIEAEGKAKGEALKAEQLASVVAQTTLAKEIGENEGYQRYLLGVRSIEANQVVGVAQAHALEKADIKVIANSGDATSGVKSAMELLTPKGGTQLGAMVEAFAQTPVGSAIAKKLGTNGHVAADAT